MSEEEKMIPVKASRWANLVLAARKGDMTSDLINLILAGLNDGSIVIQPEKKRQIITQISKIQSYVSEHPKA